MPVTRALLLDLASWSSQLAPQGARLAFSAAPALRGTGQARQRLNAACQWLWIAHYAIEAAHDHDPVSAADIALLQAVPVNALEPRRLPVGHETVTGLCQGTIGSAERARHAARTAVPHARWSPALTATSLRQTAMCGTVISHHCKILLRILAVRAGQRGLADLSGGLLRSADAAGHARSSWLRAARTWDQVTTDTRGTISPEAAEAADLALWTGRLAYADPRWTPALGPSHQTRPPEVLAPQPGDLPGVVAAVHHACETLTRLAVADENQIRTAARAGRLLVPTRSLPDTVDIPHPFALAPDHRVEPMLTAYHDARTASAQATTEVATIAAAVRAPSQILTAARAAIQASDNGPAAGGRRQPAARSHRSHRHGQPGPVERILRDLGVTSPADLQRAIVIDHAADQLILQTAEAQRPEHLDPATGDLTKSAGTAELISHLYASGDPRATILRAPEPKDPQHSQAEIEP